MKHFDMKKKEKPTAPVVVARLCEEFGGRLALLHKVKEPYEHYHEDGEEVPYSAIADWQEVSIPELAESEDERIRKELIDFINHYRHNTDLTSEQAEWCKKVLAYLEKQKEQKPVDFPTTDEEVKEFLETHPKVKVPEKYKTPDFVFSKQEYESHPIISKDTTSVKPVEWSEEDKQWLSEVYFAINHSMYSEVERQAMKKYIDSLRSQSKTAVWSEEDEHRMTDAIYFLESAKIHYADTSEIDKTINYLKSLRSQPQGIYQQVVKGLRDMCDRYEQNGMFTDGRARDFLGNVRVKCKDAIECAAILDEPHWKPSEEQMKALSSAKDDCIGDTYEVLDSLYIDLKKL